MKLKQHVYNCDGNYEWQADYLDCRLTFSDDLQRLQINKIEGDEVSEEYEIWDLYPHNKTPQDSGYYDWRLSTGGVSITKSWDDDIEWKPINSMGEFYFIANNRDLWGEYVDRDNEGDDEEWESETAADRILSMHKCGMLDVEREVEDMWNDLNFKLEMQKEKEA